MHNLPYIYKLQKAFSVPSPPRPGFDSPSGKFVNLIFFFFVSAFSLFLYINCNNNWHEEMYKNNKDYNKCEISK